MSTTRVKPRKSLWRELRDGGVGPWVRVLITFAVGFLLTAVAFFTAVLLAQMVGPLGRDYYSGMRYPSDETVAFTFMFYALVYLAALWWIWSGLLKNKGFWLAGALTLGGWMLVIPVCVLIDENLRGAGELLIAAVIFTGLATTMFIWVQTWRWYGRGRPTHDAKDGKLDLRCPNCGYRMVGLSESRCPECGTQYTIDELLAKQGFANGPSPLPPGEG